MDFKEWLSSNKNSLPDATRENFEKLYLEFIDFKANEYMLELKEKKQNYWTKMNKNIKIS